MCTDCARSQVSSKIKHQNWIFATVCTCELVLPKGKLCYHLSMRTYTNQTPKLNICYCLHLWTGAPQKETLLMVHQCKLTQIKHKNWIFTQQRNSAIPSMQSHANEIEYLLQLTSANLNTQKVNSLLLSVNANLCKSNWPFATIHTC